MANDRKTDRREFLQLMGLGSVAATLNSSIAKALSIPAHVRHGDIRDVEHIVILMQENNSFEEIFGTMRGVRGFSDPRAVKQQNGNSVFLQPAKTSLGGTASGYSENGIVYGWPATQFGGVTSDLVVPPFQIDASAVPATSAPSNSGAISNMGLVYRPGLDHGWGPSNTVLNNGQWDGWVPGKNPLTMAFRERQDAPYHFALADAFTIGDNYFCSFRGPTNVNRCYLWTGCIGNIPGNVLPDGTPTAQGTNGHGGGIVTNNGYVNGYPLSWPTYPEALETAGISWKIYQDILGDSPSTPTAVVNSQGDGEVPSVNGVSVCNGNFVGTYTDNSILYFKQIVDASANPSASPLFQKAATGTGLAYNTPAQNAPRSEWVSWAEGLFAQFRSDIQNNTLPQVSWLVAPAGYTEHPAYPTNYGAWYISQALEALTSNPEVFSKTVFIINYDENDGSFDHIPSPIPAISTDGSDGASTVATDYEQVPGSPAIPLGFGFRVPLIVVSPWSKGGYVNSELMDHTSVVKFIERRFGVHCPNISPWRRAVSGDLTSCFNFANPNGGVPKLPDTSTFLPVELAKGGGSTFTPNSSSQITLGLVQQEKGVRPARALPYQLDVHASVSGSTVTLQFINTGKAAAVFHVRSGNAGDRVRHYTVEAGRKLSGSWTVPATGAATYDLSVYGPNGFFRAFKGSADSSAAALDVRTTYATFLGGYGSLGVTVTNLCKQGHRGPFGFIGRLSAAAKVKVLDAYTGRHVPVALDFTGAEHAFDWSLDAFYGWYDLVITVEDDPTFEYRLAGHLETGRDSFSDPAMGGLVKLKA